MKQDITRKKVIKNSAVWELMKEPINVFPTEGGIKATFYLRGKETPQC